MTSYDDEDDCDGLGIAGTLPSRGRNADKNVGMKGIECPVGLSQRGREARRIIVEFLRKHRMTDTGGCRMFYGPKEWTEERGEQYGKNSVLVVVYDGGGMYSIMNGDFSYRLSDELSTALSHAGFFMEPCTCWYAAVYEG